MSNPHLPVETLDHILDFLHDSTHALRHCCLVSKSWIPHTRSHLFAEIRFRTAKNLDSWKDTFPDPSTSPACFTKSLSVDCPQAVTAVDAEAGGWLRGFSRVVRFAVASHGFGYLPGGLPISFVPFHGFSPVKYLRVDPLILLTPQLSDLIFSFPLLEDLIVYTGARPVNNGEGPNGPQVVTQLSNSPACTGTLILSREAMAYIARRLLSIPGGIHFRELALTWTDDRQLSLAMAIMEECLDTLEYLNISCISPCASTLHLRRSQYLTPLSSRVEANFDQPLEGDET